MLSNMRHRFFYSYHLLKDSLPQFLNIFLKLLGKNPLSKPRILGHLPESDDVLVHYIECF